MSAQACLQKIFTVGRTGYLGRHLIPKLVEQVTTSKGWCVGLR